jgi:hypothetical protein
MPVFVYTSLLVECGNTCKSTAGYAIAHICMFLPAQGLVRQPACTAAAIIRANMRSCTAYLETHTSIVRPLQGEYELSNLSRIVVINRLDGFQQRIQCYKMELRDAANILLYTYYFTTASNGYIFRNTNDPTFFASTCNRPAAPPPMPPVPLTPACPAAADEFTRYIRISWRGGTGCTVGSSPLHVAEVQVNYNGRNIALNKPASALPGDNGWMNASLLGQRPGMVVDGKSSTIYHSNSSDSSTFLMVDLQVRAAGSWACRVPRA